MGEENTGSQNHLLTVWSFLLVTSTVVRVRWCNAPEEYLTYTKCSINITKESQSQETLHSKIKQILLQLTWMVKTIRNKVFQLKIF